MTAVNPEILVWARETAGLTVDEAVEKLGIGDTKRGTGIERLRSLESGNELPTRPLLLKMAQHYRRPILTFYLAAPPRRGDRGEDFRNLPDGQPPRDRALADVVVRDISARQSLVRNLLIEEDEDEKLDFVGSARKNEGATELARVIAERIGFQLPLFRRNRSLEEAFTYLRSLVESAGIFVLLVDNLGSHHTEIPIETFRGFAISDNIAPFVAINANDSKGAITFTLLHELCHIWLGQTGVSGQRSVREIEKFCDEVAGEILVPKNELQSLRIPPDINFTNLKDVVSTFSRARNVSSTMLSFKLLQAGQITQESFEALRASFRSDFLRSRQLNRERSRDAEGGPTYPVIKRFRAGQALVKLIERMLGSGAITTVKAGRVLGVSGKSVESIIRPARQSNVIGG